MTRTTGWPPGLLQDDSRELARWFSTRPDARRVVREVAYQIKEKRMNNANTRTAFEAWVHSAPEVTLCIDMKDESGEYEHADAHYAWLAWQAAAIDTQVPADRAALASAPTAREQRLRAAMDRFDATGAYPGMIAAFEQQFGQTWTDPEWRQEASVWAAAWKAAQAATPAPAAGPTVEKMRDCIEKLKLRIIFIGWPAESMWNPGHAWLPDWRYELQLIDHVLHGSPITTPQKPTDTVPHNQLPAADDAAWRDAERYRWLRHGDNDEPVMRTYDPSSRNARAFDSDLDNTWLLRGEDLDAAIDAARTKKGNTP